MIFNFVTTDQQRSDIIDTLKQINIFKIVRTHLDNDVYMCFCDNNCFKFDRTEIFQQKIISIYFRCITCKSSCHLMFQNISDIDFIPVKHVEI